jgi:hypothetical protein
MSKLSRFLLPFTVIVASIIISIIMGSFYFKNEELKQKREECKSLSVGLMRQWNNIVGITYNELAHECYVIYKDPKTGDIKESPLDFMSTSK